MEEVDLLIPYMSKWNKFRLLHIIYIPIMFNRIRTKILSVLRKTYWRINYELS